MAVNHYFAKIALIPGEEAMKCAQRSVEEMNRLSIRRFTDSFSKNCKIFNSNVSNVKKLSHTIKL
jgi:hypothetical protein